MQGKFWEYHDRLFANQNALAVDNLKQYAAALGLDAAAFDTCLDGGAMTALVRQDMTDANRYGVSSTPTIFINGRFLSGAQPFERFEQIIQEELARQ